jgi:hypothetical protein
MYVHFLYLCQLFLEGEIFQTKVAEKLKTHILCPITFFLRKSCIVWDNVEKYRTARQAIMTIWRMRSACWTPKATNTQSEYVILIDFPLQQWLHECASLLGYTYIASLVLRNYGLLFKTHSTAHTTGLLLWMAGWLRSGKLWMVLSEEVVA